MHVYQNLVSFSDLTSSDIYAYEMNILLST